MNKLTEDFIAFAKSKRVDVLGIAPIERFADVPVNHHPATIFPEVKNVIVLGKRITRGTLRGIEEGTQFSLYGQYGQSWLMDRMLAITTIGVATWLEDNRWEAVPIQDLPPEVPPSGIAVKPGLPAPNVMIDVREAAVRAGVGEIGYCGELLTPEFGPRQRFQLILTDAPLDPTAMLEKSVCDKCGLCAKSCPKGAFKGEKTVIIAGKEMLVADIDYNVCRTCKNGATGNPQHQAGRPDRLGAVCLRSCVNHLEAEKLIGNSLVNPFRQREAWTIDGEGKTVMRSDI